MNTSSSDLLRRVIRREIQEIVSPKQAEDLDFKFLVQSFNKYLNSISRAEMFDDAGNYNSTIKNYLTKIKKFEKDGTEDEKLVASHLLGFF
jgi:predicted nucleic acid-binding protein